MGSSARLELRVAKGRSQGLQGPAGLALAPAAAPAPREAL